jgi:hypothetical protein
MINKPLLFNISVESFMVVITGGPILRYNAYASGTIDIPWFDCQADGTINIQNDRKTVALPNQTTIISFDIIGGRGAIIKEPRICYVLPSIPCPPSCSSKSFDVKNDRKNNATTRPGHQQVIFYYKRPWRDAMELQLPCGQRYSRRCYHVYSMHCPAATFQPAFITSEPTTTTHHRTTIDLFEPIGSRGTVAKGRYCHVGEDIADAATIIAPFTVLKRRRKNDQISAPTRPTTTTPRRKRWIERRS